MFLALLVWAESLQQVEKHILYMTYNATLLLRGESRRVQAQQHLQRFKSQQPDWGSAETWPMRQRAVLFPRFFNKNFKVILSLKNANKKPKISIPILFFSLEAVTLRTLHFFNWRSRICCPIIFLKEKLSDLFKNIFLYIILKKKKKRKSGVLGPQDRASFLKVLTKI